MAVDVFIDEVPSYEIKEGIMYVAVGDWRMAMPLRKFRLGMVRAAKIIAAHDARSAEVVPLRRKGKG